MTAATTVSFRRDAQVISLVGLAHGTSHFFHLSLAPLFPWLKDAFAVSYAELGLLMSVFFIVSGLGQALAGFVVDRFGAMRVLFGGIALLGLSALGLAASTNYPMLALFAGVAGLGNCVFHPADFTLLNRRVSVPRLGYAFSVHGLTGTLGWAVAPVFLAGIASISTWRVALLSASVLAFTVLAVLIAFRHLLDPRELSDAVVDPAEKKATAGGMLAFMKVPAVWMCFAFFFISSISFGGIQSFAATALHELYEIPLTYATACITAYMLASAGGIVVGGFLAARFAQHDKVIAIAFAAAGAVSVLVASAVPPAAMVIVLLGAIGFGSGVAGPSRDLLVRAAAPKGATGRVYGVVYSGLDIGLSGAPLMFGMLMDAHHPGWVFIGIGAFQALSLVAVLGVGEQAMKRQAQAA
ncbi:MAG: MFS transporter [Betaproteobacteria bacterium]|jgi:FSR family fosmidomycin resistance protein-like MFS transporter